MHYHSRLIPCRWSASLLLVTSVKNRKLDWLIQYIKYWEYKDTKFGNMYMIPLKDHYHRGRASRQMIQISLQDS